MHGKYVIGSTLRVVLEPIYLFLSDEGFEVRSMTQTPDWDTSDVVLTRVLIVGWYGI